MRLSRIKTGSGSTFDGTKYLWAIAGCWRVHFYPDLGGASAWRKIGVGWFDDNGAMPERAFDLLLAMAKAQDLPCAAF